MAEFCLECHNRLNGKSFEATDVILTEGLYFCEECCTMRPVVVGYIVPKILFNHRAPRKGDTSAKSNRTVGGKWHR